MFYGFTEEDLDFVNLAQKYAQKRLAPLANDSNPCEATAKAVDKELAEMGFVGMCLPEEYGGMGASRVQYCGVIEALSTVTDDFNTIISKVNMDGIALIKYAGPALREKYLPQMIAGEIVPATALTEPNVGSDASGVQTTATLGADGNWHINGSKMFCSQHCGKADIFLLVAQTDKALGYKGIATFIVERTFPGFNDHIVGDIVCEGPYMMATELVLEDLIVPPENLVGQVGQGFMAISSALDIGRLTIAATCVGVCQRAINVTTEYVKQRKQFGREIGQFQLVQARLADMITETEAARSLLYRAASVADQSDGDRMECSYAKYFCSEVAQRVTYNAIQLHGGYGLSKEYPVAKLWTGMRQNTIVDGTSDIQRLMIGRKATGFDALKR
jgi:butyryl-CoA dehydrogenase